ncbi:hypothetical protein OIU34_20775 [Pararhizobium sp. BT-229]|uniref:hypothetical protein n=1 Tax=Pararhizobium sp. BT-229 TaxID=2986923 RepID=UPI0021F7EA65|nr:hypothetical protein [Pararhizobium sp. BT-229]MCV9964325.1 hypothetical protein [Pararhizobium sp. BT-229]
MKKMLTSIREAFTTRDAELNMARKRRYVCIVLGGVLCVIFWKHVLTAYLYLLFFIILVVAYCVYTMYSLLDWLQHVV